MKVGLGGGTPVMLASGQTSSWWSAQGIAVDAMSVYWTSIDSGTVMKIAK